MKEIKQTIVINRPVEEVFTFTTNPTNTPKWVDSIAIEQTDEWPVKIGTIYRGQNHAGEWSELGLIRFEANKIFTLRLPDGGQVSYNFSASGADATRLDYTWASDGRLDALFLDKILTKLKVVIEAA
jgi:uncharacterized protein YndB with AHSA1/START domain